MKKSLGRFIYFIRHFRVINHKSFVPKYDTKVTLPEKQKIKEVIKLLPQDSYCFSSPMLRSKITCKEFINCGLKYSSLNFEPELQEQRLGILEGLSISEAWKYLENSEKHAWSFISAKFLPPSSLKNEPSESFGQVLSRVRKFLNNIDPNPELPPILIFTHSGVIRAAIACCIGIDPDKSLGFKIDNFSLTCFEKQKTSLKGGAWQIHFINRDLN